MYPDSRLITIHGAAIHYRVIMPAEEVRYRVLLVASPGQSTFSWRYIVPELTEAGCMCVLCDLPGYGLSECRNDVPQDHETRARILWGLLDTIDLKQGERLNCWHLMAHGSAAGTIATMALLQPDSAASLMMLCPILYPLLPGFLLKLVQKPFFTRLLSRWIDRYIVPKNRFSRLTALLYGAPLNDRLDALLHRSALQLVGHEELIRNLLLTGYRVETHRLNDLFMPAMIIWGGRDAILGGTIPARLRTKDFKSAEYHVLAGSGHCPAETNSHAVRDYLRGWIRELWG